MHFYLFASSLYISYILNIITVFFLKKIIHNQKKKKKIEQIIRSRQRHIISALKERAKNQRRSLTKRKKNIYCLIFMFTCFRLINFYTKFFVIGTFWRKYFLCHFFSFNIILKCNNDILAEMLNVNMVFMGNGFKFYVFRQWQNGYFL